VEINFIGFAIWAVVFLWLGVLICRRNRNTKIGTPSATFASQIADKIELIIGPIPRSERGTKDWHELRRLCQQLRNGK